MKWQKFENKMVLELEFSSQTELAQFLLKVATFSDRIDHHVDITVTKAYHLRLDLHSHDSGGLTKRDERWLETFEKEFL